MALRIALAQLNLLVGDIEGNAGRIMTAAERARDEQQADLIVFPELTLTGYPPEDLLLRHELVMRVEAALDTLCRSISGITAVVGYPKQREDGIYNTAGVIRDGRLVAEYDKTLLPNYSVFDEKRYFESGDEACVVDIDGLKIGITICEDIWYREPAEQAKQAGAEILVNLNASPFHKGKSVEREELVAKRAQETGLPVVYVNLVGGQDELVFDGGSFVANAEGARTTPSMVAFPPYQKLVSSAAHSPRWNRYRTWTWPE